MDDRRASPRSPEGSAADMIKRGRQKCLPLLCCAGLSFPLSAPALAFRNKIEYHLIGLEGIITESNVNTPVTMKARILRVRKCDLLVCDLCTCQQVEVHTAEACCFRVGEKVCITYSGAMTMSIPPQISADSIERLGRC